MRNQLHVIFGACGICVFFGLAFVLRNGSLATQVNPTPSDSLFSPLIFPVPVFQLFTVPTISLPELGFFGNQLKMVPPIFLSPWNKNSHLTPFLGPTSDSHNPLFWHSPNVGCERDLFVINRDQTKTKGSEGR